MKTIFSFLFPVSNIKRIKLMFILMFAVSYIKSNADAINDWNSIANTVFLKALRPGGAALVDMAYVHIAIYDAVNAIDGSYSVFAVKPSNAVNWASKEAAAGSAAYNILLTFYPDQKNFLDSVYNSFLSTIPNSITKSRGELIGKETAELFLLSRQGDGRNAVVQYTFGSGPGVYQLTPGAPAPPATPQTPWLATLKPFTLQSPSQFRAPDLPELTSDKYAADLNEIKQYGVKENSLRTAEQTEIGMFYAENPGNQMSRNMRLISGGHNLDIAKNARFFAQIYVTLADACIAAWDSKFYYNFWRPVTAIHNADTDNNPLTERDTSWLPLVTTPGHPEYPAAHGCVTGGLAFALAKFFGTENMDITLTSTSVSGILLAEHHFSNINDIAAEIVNARVYGGMHFRNSGEAGVEIGRSVAEWVNSHKFQEGQIPMENLQLWLSADKGMLPPPIGAVGYVSKWPDQSGNGHDAVQSSQDRWPTYVTEVVNGRPAISFDGENDCLGLIGTDSMSQITLFIVQRINPDATGQNFYYPITLGNTYKDGNVYGLSMRNDFSENSPNIIDPFTGISSWLHASVDKCAEFDKWKIITVSTDRKMWNTKMRVNGVDATITPQGTTNLSISVPLGNSSGTGVGGIGGADNTDVGSLVFKGQIAEVIIYDTLLSGDQQLELEHYLSDKYDIKNEIQSIPSDGVQLWLKADAGLHKTGSTIAEWIDQSGNGNNVIQPVDERKPELISNGLNGKPVLRFDGSDDMLGLTGDKNMDQISLFMVYKVDSGATGPYPNFPVLLGDANIPGKAFGVTMQNPDFANSPDFLAIWTSAESYFNAVLPGIAKYGEWKNLSIITNKTILNSFVRSNRVQASIVPQGPDHSILFALSNPYGPGRGGGIGGADGTPSPGNKVIFKGEIAEIIIYDTVLTNLQRDSVEQYLSDKYNIITDVEEKQMEVIPSKFFLSQNFPNPFNPSTTISFSIPSTGFVTLKIYDVLGREVKTLLSEERKAGIYELNFNAANLSSGIYFYKLKAGKYEQTNKLILLK